MSLKRLKIEVRPYVANQYALGNYLYHNAMCTMKVSDAEFGNDEFGTLVTFSVLFYHNEQGFFLFFLYPA